MTESRSRHIAKIRPTAYREFSSNFGKEFVVTLDDGSELQGVSTVRVEEPSDGGDIIYIVLEIPFDSDIIDV